MFTLRFMRTNGDSTVATSLTYDVTKCHAPGSTPAKPLITHAVITIPNPAGGSAVPITYMIGQPVPAGEGKGYHQCFVENAVGKTIDRIGPFNGKGR
jgi:hypothetical protein